MKLSSSWIAGIVSSLAAFFLAFSIESFRSLPLFWSLYIGLGAAWLALSIARAPGKGRIVLPIPSFLLLIGIISLFVNFVPLALALFIVFANTIPLTRNYDGRRVFGALPITAMYVLASYVLVLIGGYMPLVVAPIAYVLAGVAIIAWIGRVRTGNSPSWPDAMAGIALIGVLLWFSEKRASVGAAAAAAGVAFLVRAASASQSKSPSGSSAA